MLLAYALNDSQSGLETTVDFIGVSTLLGLANRRKSTEWVNNPRRQIDDGITYRISAGWVK